ncbi:TonB-dependent receptor [Novosphingobium sp. G106]|uniref:TonB-dependent receptor n=1 Tax=Novosphingobium sp. G106 TaxID=2849500 RepID=UPI001C2D4E8C|nr:TonB-dependent receptor [Novosphingobium sp. G106]MBV1689757.1 TonB-dependent receptor [Novosphingobium sp. G106]
MKTHQSRTIHARRRLRLATMLGASALAAPFSVTPALAQGAEASVDSNTIVVTAQRRAEAVEDVPMTVTVVTPETLSQLGVNSVRDLQNVTSGFSLNNSGTYPQPAIRGVTTTNSGSYENNVALWVDGLYQITPQVLNMDLPNVQSIQVLKGPQGALYGRNATGGAILLDTIDPGSSMKGNLEATYARFDDRRARGYVAGPLSDNVGFSIAGTYRKTDGYYKKVSLTDVTKTDGRTLGLEQESVRAKLKGELGALTATIGYNFTRASDPRGAYFTPFENLTAGFTPRNLGDVSEDAAVLDFKQHEGSLKLELDTGIGTLRSVTGYQHSSLVTTYDSDGRYSAFGLTGVANDTISDSLIFEDTWQENVDYTINAIKNLDLIIGGTYFNNKEKFGKGRENANYVFPNTPTSGPGTPFSAYRLASTSDYARTKEAFALFLDATFHVTDKLSINVGGRYSKETQDISAVKTSYCAVLTGCAALGATAITIPFGASRGQNYNATNGSTYSKFTPRASIRYEIAPRTNIYASYSQGFKAGEWNGVIPFDTAATWKQFGQIGQETIDAFEVGVKGAGHNYSFDLSGFYYNYHNLQVSSVQFVNGVTGVLLQTIPKAKIYGAEANFSYNVMENFKVNAGATWLHARYGDGAYYRGTSVNPAAAAFPNSVDPLRGATNVFIPPAWQDISHMQMVRAPDFSGFVGFEYKVPQGEGGLTFAGNLKYTSSYVVTDASIWGGESDASYTARKNAAVLAGQPVPAPNNQQTLQGTAYVGRANEQRARQSGYALVNASITWADPTDHYYVRVWGNNLTNKIYKVHYRPTTRTYAPIGEPLTFGGTVGYKF